MIIVDNTPLLTREVPIDHGASEIRFLLLQLVHGIETRQETKHIKSLETFFRKGIYILTGLKVSSLVQKRVFYRPELMGKQGPYETGT